MKNSLRKKLAPWKLRYRIIKAKYNHKRKLKEIASKENIKVAFLVVNESIWKYDTIYTLFQQDNRFEPVIFVCPYMTYGEDVMKKEMNSTFKSLVNKGYKVVKTALEDDEWLDIKNNFKPDLVFFSTPWAHSLPKYGIRNYLDTLTCYVPYGFKNSNLYKQHFNLETQNLCWKFFLETKIHQKLANKYAVRKGENTVVTGAPGMDSMLTLVKDSQSVWKIQDTNKKRIIWAPHHTIPGAKKNILNYSTFLTYFEFMLDLTSKYKDVVQFAFKPHPNLRGKLYEIWGKEKTDEYYKKWEKLPNGQLEEGEFVELFYQSDAMIHDSGSFVIDYLYTKKPVMFLIGSEKVKEEFNEIGKQALSVIDKGYNKEDIKAFIEEVVLKGNDLNKQKRISFFEEIIKPPNNRTASENIYYYISKILQKC